MSEKTFSNFLQQRIASQFIQSFESVGLPGVPDLYVVPLIGEAYWLELKVMMTDGARIPFRPGQPQWLDRHADAGGRANVVVQFQSSALVLYAGDCRRMARMSLKKAVATYLLKEIPMKAPYPWAI